MVIYVCTYILHGIILYIRWYVYRIYSIVGARVHLLYYQPQIKLQIFPKAANFHFRCDAPDKALCIRRARMLLYGECTHVCKLEMAWAPQRKLITLSTPGGRT